MKIKPFIFLFLLYIPVQLFGQVYVFRNYLSSALNGRDFVSNYNEIKQWRLSQKSTLQQKVLALPDDLKKEITDKADEYLNYGWPSLPATIYLEYKINGNRSNFEERLSERRKALSNITAAFLITKDKKYFTRIVNGLWAFLEESTWVLPAHIEAQKIGSGLPDPGEEVIDLFSGQTAAIVANIQFMLYDEMESYSPVINKRIKTELRKRIVIPYLERTDSWWMGFGSRKVNNWNPWININILHTELLTETNPDTLNKMVAKILKSTDNFINIYPEDGGCDEGVNYWGVAGGNVIRLLYLINSATAGKLNWSDIGLLHNMGSYIYKVHISEDKFVNFADASALVIPNPESVYRFGKYFNDDTLRNFAAFLFSLKKNVGADNITDFLQMADIYQEISSDKNAAPPLPAYSCLPDLQVVTARTKAGTDKSLFLAVQGGHNDESHNHNDVGNFILYVDGRPVIVDAGVGIYNAQTFSSRRYEIWNMQSQWHNCPTINTVMQKEGKEFRATGFSCTCNKKNEITIKMDIAKAYPQ